MPSVVKRDRSLDAVRAIAIGLVVLFHYTTDGMPPHQLSGPMSYLMTLDSLGWVGVDLFFVLSGYLIGGILIDNRDTANFFGVFYLRRATRILPLYLLALVIAHWYRGQFKEPAALLYLLTFTQNFWMAHNGGFAFGGLNVTWSLALEEQFYLAAPVLIRLMPPKGLPAALIALIALAPLGRSLIWLTYPAGHEWMAAYVLPFARMDCFAMGVLLAHAQREPAWRSWILAHLPSLLGAAAFCGSIAVILVFTGHTWRGPLFSIVGLTLVAVACSGLLLLFATRNGLAWMLLFRVLAPVGIGAYSIYLFHTYGPVLASHLVDWAAAGSLTRIALMVGFNTLVAVCLWNLVEKPFIRLGHRARYSPATTHGRERSVAQG